jgi:type I restriction enzyme M protein
MVNQDVAGRLWAVADQLWANTGLRPSEFSTPVLGLVFLRYAESRFAEVEERIGKVGSGGRRKVKKEDYQAEGVIFLRDEARFSYLQSLTESDNIGKAINDAMKAIEEENPDLKGVLPRSFTDIDNITLVGLLKMLGPVEVDGDAFGAIYEYFLGNFAMKEGRKGGVFYTPTSIVSLIVEIIEPFKGRIYDPACGSGGMFAQSARFVKNHKKNPDRELSIFGVEKDSTTMKLAKMNLAVHGLGGEIWEANSYYEDPHNSCDKLGGRFDYVMANPPFNVSGVDKDRLTDDPRFKLGIPTPDNANYLWIQNFYSALNEHGRAGFVMANSAADARGTELEIRKRLIQDKSVDVVVSVGSNFFYTVTLPCTLWFFDRGKKGTGREDSVLFIDARHIYRQVDRAHRDFLPEQIEFLSNIVHLYRGNEPLTGSGSKDLMQEHGLDNGYRDVNGLCKVANLEEIEAQGWSLNPGRYVGIADRAPEDFDFVERMEELNEDLEVLNAEGRGLESQISSNLISIFESQ